MALSAGTPTGLQVQLQPSVEQPSAAPQLQAESVDSRPRTLHSPGLAAPGPFPLIQRLRLPRAYCCGRATPRPQLTNTGPTATQPQPRAGLKSVAKLRTPAAGCWPPCFRHCPMNQGEVEFVADRGPSLRLDRRAQKALRLLSVLVKPVPNPNRCCRC